MLWNGQLHPEDVPETACCAPRSYSGSTRTGPDSARLRPGSERILLTSMTPSVVRVLPRTPAADLVPLPTTNVRRPARPGPSRAPASCRTRLLGHCTGEPPTGLPAQLQTIEAVRTSTGGRPLARGPRTLLVDRFFYVSFFGFFVRHDVRRPESRCDAGGGVPTGAGETFPY